MASRCCTKCKEEKPIEEFYLNCYGRNAACRTCVAAKNKAYYQAKKATIATRHSQRREEGVAIDVGAVARRRNTDFTDRYAARREKVNTTKSERYKSDPSYHAAINEDTALRRALDTGGALLERAVGCDEKFFREWIEYQFTGEMTAENHVALWSYDHVIPRSEFDLRDPNQVLECNNWRNLRPVISKENSVKHNKRDIERERQQEINASMFELIQTI